MCRLLLLLIFSYVSEQTKYSHVFYIINDLVIIIFWGKCVFFAHFWFYLFSAWIFGTVICKVMAYAQGVSVAASVYSLVAISADRFVGSKFRKQAHKFFPG